MIAFPSFGGVPERRGGKYLIMEQILTYINNIPIKRNFVKDLPYNYSLKIRAKALRKAGNYSEVAFWLQVHKGKFHKIDFDRQRIIGNFIVDFYCDKISLVIEVDGGYHEGLNMLKKDGDRDLDLYNLGITVIRFTNEEVLNQTYDVVKKIKKEVLNLLKIKNISL